MIFKLNDLDCAGMIARGGLKFKRFKGVTKDTGRNTQDFSFHRTVIATKLQIDVTCKPLTGAQAAQLFGQLAGTWVQVTFLSPYTNQVETKTLYSDDEPAAFLIERGGEVYWEGIEFPLIEK